MFVLPSFDKIKLKFLVFFNVLNDTYNNVKEFESEKLAPAL
jgi:hypothetical protein